LFCHFFDMALRAITYALVGSNQQDCYDASESVALSACPSEGSPFYGQDAQGPSTPPSYSNNGDGTVTDHVTGLMWLQNAGSKVSYADGIANVDSVSTGGHTDWRVPTIKELFSLIEFSGTDPDPMGTSTMNLKPFIDDSVFEFHYGNTSVGDRIIDSQWITTNIYVDHVMGGQSCFFGVNFADGRIKCYPLVSMSAGYYAVYVRGNPDYGTNAFSDNGDGTVIDSATGRMWMQQDAGVAKNWEQALSYCENFEIAGHSDWRLPQAKELQSLIDYTRSPATTNSSSIDPVFSNTPITNEAGEEDYGFYWTSSTHVSQTNTGESADYLCFGRCLGYFKGEGMTKKAWIDVHGAGAQRSDPKDGTASDYPHGRGPQGDAIRIFNMVRCVRGPAQSEHSLMV
jgi:hypothetical protein